VECSLKVTEILDKATVLDVTEEDHKKYFEERPGYSKDIQLGKCSICGRVGVWNIILTHCITAEKHVIVESDN
jgi:hypothetical protein